MTSITYKIGRKQYHMMLDNKDLLVYSNKDAWTATKGYLAVHVPGARLVSVCSVKTK